MFDVYICDVINKLGQNLVWCRTSSSLGGLRTQEYAGRDW